MKDRDIPKKPIEASKQHKKLGYMHDCPSCYCSIGYKEKSISSLPRFLRRTVLYEQCLQYCGFCGQKFDWS